MRLNKISFELVIYLSHCILVCGEYSFPSFDWFHASNEKKGQESKDFFSEQPKNYKHLDKSKNSNHFARNHEVDKDQALEDFNFNAQPENYKSQELQKFHYSQVPKGQEVEEFVFGSKPEELKGQKLEKWNFDSSKKQDVKEIKFSIKPEKIKNQEFNDYDFGLKPKKPIFQKIEEINFGSKPGELKGQESEVFDFNHEPKGQEIEDIFFGKHREEHKNKDKNKGQEIEEINFGSKPEGLKGQKSEVFDFNHEPKGQEIEDIVFGINGKEHKGEDKNKGQEIEEINFGSKPEGPKGQESEVFDFNHEPKGQEIEDIVFGKHREEHKNKDKNKGQEIEEINFGSKPEGLKGQKSEVFDFNHEPKGQEIEDIVFGINGKEHKGEDKNKGQEIEEINFGSNYDKTPLENSYYYQHNKKKNCEDLPQAPVNSIINCQILNQECKAICFEGYEFFENKKEWTFVCKNGQWTAEGHLSKDELKCKEKDPYDLHWESKTNKTFDKFSNIEVNPSPIIEKHEEKESGECNIWNDNRYRTFDGKIYSFESNNCSYILAEDVGNVFKIIKEDAKCFGSNCSRTLKIFYQEKLYKLLNKENAFIFKVEDQVKRIPIQLDNVLVEQKNDGISLTLQSTDLKLIWNYKNHISIKINVNMWNKMLGLCGNFNDNSENEFYTEEYITSDLQSYVYLGKDDNIENTYNCNSIPVVDKLCTNRKALEYCEKVFADIYFERCLEIEELKAYKNACIWDFCECGKNCACETIQEFVNTCIKYLIKKKIPDSLPDWREITQCILDCPPGQVYSNCKSNVQYTCRSVETPKVSKYSECVEGCFCPGDTVLFNNTCIKKESCPCQWKMKNYFYGEKIQKDCNICTCQNGEWICTNLKCGARCSLTGDFHYLTFDGKRYDFKGTCSYYLLKNSEYAVIASSIPCLGEFDKYPGEIFNSFGIEHTLCLNMISIRHGQNDVKLKRYEEVLVNGVEVSSIPTNINGIIIRKISSFYIVVTLPDEVEVWWDGNSNVYVDLPVKYEKNTAGLCGTFNNNQKDDFLTPEGDIEQTPTAFAEKWKSEETCTETVDGLKFHPCEINKNSKILAEKYCKKLKDNFFKDCHQYVDVEAFYKNCLHDVCSCKKEAKYCFCPIFSDYGIECSKQGIEIPWRVEIRECGLHCPPGQTYQPCGNSCTRTCQDIAINNGYCISKCVDGCNCPEGLTLNSLGQCIPISTCSCFHQNVKYKAAHELIKESVEGPQYCICENATWSCRPATKLEIARDYENSSSKCNSTIHLEYTTCEPAEPKTCKNMHEKPKQTTRICFPGCVCKKGYIWDSIGKKCVPSTECPCHHGGRSYLENEIIQQDCNKCTCLNGLWNCTEKKCASICSAWGDTHFKTFDGKIYDFQGSCEFVMASGTLTPYDSFFISLEILPCGSTGISCPKSVTLSVGPPDKEEQIVFSKSNSVLMSKELNRILIRKAGLFIFAEIIDLGITLQWDKGTRVYIKASSKWQNRTKGLCGNFNYNAMDDFKTPFSGETSEISPILFADSWRLYNYCPESHPIIDPCVFRPNRKSWAVNKCSILKSEIFEPCQSEVPVDFYFERCIIDACGCDEGGDCECLCTAIAAYAQECIIYGVPIKWRSQEFCPLQCDDPGSEYSPCFSTCPPKSCDNYNQQVVLQQTCSQEFCVEGCQKKSCPDEQIFADSQSNHCIPLQFCKNQCLTINNVTYLEGDLMESDDCHSCFCSRHKKVCTGKPCSIEINVTEKEKTTTEGIINITNDIFTNTSPCPLQQTWHNCFISCDNICNHLRNDATIKEKCHSGEHCLSGCRSLGFECPPGMFLRDETTCVHAKDCPCLSSNGFLIKPGEVIEVTDCEKCQCINNELECISTCSSFVLPITNHPINNTQQRFTTQKIAFGEAKTVLFTYHTTISPSHSFCPSAQFETLMGDFTKFSASSNLNELSSPEYANMYIPKGHWAPASDTTNEYLQVDLGKVEPVYAVNIAGGSGKYVTGYHIQYSLNGHNFIDVTNKNRKKEIFGGPFDGQHSVKVVLPEPIEAKYIRFLPVFWHEGIAMKIDILGCKDLEISTIPFTSSLPLLCNKQIGIGEKYFPELHISVSSSKSQSNIEHIGLNEEGWQPLINSKSEYIQLDFGSFVNFTGILTKGIHQSNFRKESWVERYKVTYSSDAITWNPVLDDFGNEMIFMGNIDDSTIKQNSFIRPIHAKVLRILPIKWHENIALKIDIMGCYEPTILEVEPTSPPIHRNSNCSICEGLPVDLENCSCKENQWWDGERCITHSECPCFVGFIAYPVGTMFTTEKCEECICKMYGIPHCTPKICDDCPQGLQKFLTPLCGCTCKPCEENTRLCPTSNVCVDSSVWCNGIEDCPDDEVNCTTPAPKESKSCNSSCPEGYNIVYRNNRPSSFEIEDIAKNSSYQNLKSVKTKKFIKSYKGSKKTKSRGNFLKFTDCPSYDCMPSKNESLECPVPACPINYLVTYEKAKTLETSCSEFKCKPLPEFANCTVSSRHIKTFDGTQYKYEICDHVLARDDQGLWNVSMIKTCAPSTPCVSELLIHHENFVIELNPHNQTIKFNSFIFNNSQINLLNSKIQDIIINSIGTSIIFTSLKYGFEIFFDSNENFKIKVTSTSKGHINGLCGFYNSDSQDDTILPDGKLSKTTVEFGNRWFNRGGKECIETFCALESQKTALEICSVFREKPFSVCGEEINLEQCIEKACNCLSNNNTENDCRCAMLTDFASKCSNSELLGWRIDYNCPTSCPPHLVFYDCYLYACEPTCGNEEECAIPANECYSGCFCPDGLVKNGNRCIKATECRDCICSGMGDSTYLTFDGGLTFNGNCTYVATRNKNPFGDRKFEVLITNGLCRGSNFMTCTEKVEIKVSGHSIELISQMQADMEFKIIVDGGEQHIKKSKNFNDWAKVELNQIIPSLDVDLPKEHVGVRYFYKKFAFTISLPSHSYGGELEGLCGTCAKNLNFEDIDGPEVWQTEKDKNCLIEPPKECLPTVEHEKICFKMNDFNIFGQCLTIVDSAPFIDQCLTSLCFNGHICNSFEAFGKACRDAGICVNWRSNDFCPFTCSPDMEYQFCKSGCAKTCENLENISSNCLDPLMEGCFCPDDKIFINGTCKSEKFCKFCDEEGKHFEGEIWQVDKCTQCICKNRAVICSKTECQIPEIFCKIDEILITNDNNTNCCPKYECICKPKDSCPSIEMPNEILPAGMQAIINESECCPKMEIVCKKALCPPPQPCRNHYIKRVINTTECCPEYFCERPTHLCFYEPNEKNHLLPYNRTERQVHEELIKEVGEKWIDGPCKSCVCIEKDGFAEAVCSIMECPALEHHQDFEEYELKSIYNPHKCCPEIERTHCKHNGHTYEVGDSWLPDKNSPCETMKCNKIETGMILKETRVQFCNKECDLGWEYKKIEKECCGHCRQSGCVVENKVYKEGQMWLSEDGCANNICTQRNGSFSVSTVMESCPSVEDCPKEDLYQDKCCFKCKIKPESKTVCLPQPLPPNSTLHLIKEKKGRHGTCQNSVPLKNFTQCAGNCDSYTQFDSETLTQKTVCKCCQPEEFSLMVVDLTCEDGMKIVKTLTVPSKCSCLPCGG